jgi:SagB-type dehydrogenase family enzyme
MNSRIVSVVVSVIAACGALLPASNAPAYAEDRIELPEPSLSGEVSLEQVLAERRSHRSFIPTTLPRSVLGQLLWAAQGVSDRASGKRTAPSAGAKYPLEIYAFLPSGVYRYLPREHALKRIASADLRSFLWDEVYRRDSLKTAAAAFVIGAVVQRTRTRYGKNAEKYVHMEAGHAAQNLLLQATALGWGGVGMGAFHSRKLKKRLRLSRDISLLYLIPVGKTR